MGHQTEGKPPKVQTANRNRTAHATALAVLIGLLLAACGGEAGQSTTTTEAVTTTTVPDTTTTTVRDTTTTSSPATTTTSAPTTTGGSTDTNDLASGSGCKPGTEDGLPDGDWYGYIVDVSASDIEFDLACWFSGDAAIAAASEDGAESPPPNDYYIRNESDVIRSLLVSSTAEVEYLANGGDPNSVATMPYAEWSTDWEISEFVPGYWVTIVDGEVTSIVQQYVP